MTLILRVYGGLRMRDNSYMQMRDNIGIFSNQDVVDRYAEDCRNGLYDFEKNFIDQTCGDHRSMTILCLGCGAGREVFGLLDLGHTVCGVDASEEMIAAARILNENRQNKGEFVSAFVPPIPFEGRVFDLIIGTYNLYTHIGFRAARLELLKECKKVMAEGALLILSYHEYDPARAPYVTIQGEDNFKKMPAVKEAPDKDLYIKVMSADEVRTELHEAGFSVVALKNITELSDARKIPWSKSVTFVAAKLI
jgi:SAM-dependent methyltransferase